MSSVLVLDYGVCTPQRVVQALRHAGVDCKVSSNPHDLRSADRVLVPDGPDDERSLERGLRREVLVALADYLGSKRPLLTIGLGGLFLFEGNAGPAMPSGLAVFKAPIQRFDPRMTDEHERPLKCPHTGLAYVVGLDRHPFLQPVVPTDEQGMWLYFRHRLCVPARVPFADVAVAHHGVPFAGAVWREQILMFQFLPELSGPVGIALLKAWAEAT